MWNLNIFALGSRTYVIYNPTQCSNSRKNFLNQNKYYSTHPPCQNGQLNLIHYQAPCHPTLPSTGTHYGPGDLRGELVKELSDFYAGYWPTLQIVAWSPANSLRNSGAEIFAKSRSSSVRALIFGNTTNPFSPLFTLYKEPTDLQLHSPGSKLL